MLNFFNEPIKNVFFREFLLRLLLAGGWEKKKFKTDDRSGGSVQRMKIFPFFYSVVYEKFNLKKEKKITKKS